MAANVVPSLGPGANSDPPNPSAVFEWPLSGAGKRGKRKESDGRMGETPPPSPSPSVTDLWLRPCPSSTSTILALSPKI